MKHALTRRQGECLAFIKAQLKQEDVAPSYSEIQAHLGLKHRSGVHHMLKAMEARGHITRIPGAARSITVVPDAPPETSLLRRIRDAANVFVATQETFRRDYDTDPQSDAARSGAPRVQTAFNNLRDAVRGDV
jgi:SOS-response transcriptional repressor LexA